MFLHRSPADGQQRTQNGGQYNDATDHRKIFLPDRGLFRAVSMWQAWRNVRRNEKRTERKWLPRQSRDDDDNDEAWRRTSCHHPRRLFWAYSAQRTPAFVPGVNARAAYLLEEYGRSREGCRRIHSRKRKASRTPIKMDTSRHPRQVERKRERGNEREGE